MRNTMINFNTQEKRAVGSGAKITFDIHTPLGNATEDVYPSDYTAVNVFTMREDINNALNSYNIKLYLNDNEYPTVYHEGTDYVTNITFNDPTLLTIMGGNYTQDPNITGLWKAQGWGLARIPFDFSIEAEGTIFKGGVQGREILIKKLSNRTTIGINNVASSKFIQRFGYTFNMLMDTRRAKIITAILDKRRNKPMRLDISTGVNYYGLSSTQDYYFLIDSFELLATPYDYLDIGEYQLSILEG